MFSLQQVRGIELQRLIAYIIQKNKKQKLFKQSTIHDIYYQNYSQTQIVQSTSYRTILQEEDDNGEDQENNDLEEKNKSGENDHSIDEIKQDDGEEDGKEGKNKEGGMNNNSDLFMITKPSNVGECKKSGGNSPQGQKNKKNVKFSTNNEQTKTKDNNQNKNRKLTKNNKHKKSSPQILTPINMKSIMLSLKNYTIDYLKQQFIYNDNKITLQKFLFLIKQCITYDKRRQYQVLYQLIKLFQQIDIDCNNSIDWQQFLQYLACYGWASTNDNQGSSGSMYAWEEQATGNNLRKNNLIAETWREVNKFRTNGLNKIVEVERMEMICLVQGKSFCLSFLNMKGEKYVIRNQKKQKSYGTEQDEQNDGKGQGNKNQNNEFNNNGLLKSTPSNLISSDEYQSTTHVNLFSLNYIDPKRVLSMDYSQPQKLFGILQTDKKIYFIEQGQIQKSYGCVEGAGNQIQITYLPIHRKWLLKRIDQWIDIFASPKQKNNKERIVFKPHQKDAITAIKELKNPLSLITSGIDGKIKIWSLIGKQLMIELKPYGEEQMFNITAPKHFGVKGIDTLNLSLQSYFCSWIFTPQIMIWLPSVSISKPYLGKLTGHSGIVESCEFVKPHHTSQQVLVSIDNKKVIKIWSIQKMQCLWSGLHQGNGCQIKCLNSKPVFLVYDKIIEFNKMKFNSLLMSATNKNNNGQDLNFGENKNKGNQNYKTASNLHELQKTSLLKKPIQQQQQSHNKSPQVHSFPDPNLNSTSGFIQLQFCSYNILILLLLTTQLKIINTQTGRIQAIFQPTFKDEEQFVSMSLKINRRAFIISTMGYIYYIKLDDGSLIKRIEISLNKKEVYWNNRNDQMEEEYDQKSIGKNNKFSNQIHSGKQRGQKISVSNNKGKIKHKNQYRQSMNKQNPLNSSFSAKFIHYHPQSKILTVVCQTDYDYSILITYDESTGYEFQKMKQIQFQQIQLRNIYFFNQIDLFLIVSDEMITIWEWTKVIVMNKINLKLGGSTLSNISDNSSQLMNLVGQQDFKANPLLANQQPYIKHILIDQKNTNSCYFILLLTKYDQFKIYQINPVDCSIKTIINLQILNKYKGNIRTFYFSCTTNQDVENVTNLKLNFGNNSKLKNRQYVSTNNSNNLLNNNISGLSSLSKQKQVKFNLNVMQNQYSSSSIHQNNSTSLQSSTKTHPSNIVTNGLNNGSILGENLYQQQNNNMLPNFQNALMSSLKVNNGNKTSQQNILSNKYISNPIQNKLLYFFLKDGGVVVYNMNQFVNIMKRDIFSYVQNSCNMRAKNTPNKPINGQNLKIQSPEELIESMFNNGSSGSMKMTNFNTSILNNVLMNTNSLTQEASKKYAAHKIRQTRKATIKMLLNEPLNYVLNDLEDYLIMEKDKIARPGNNNSSSMDKNYYGMVNLPVRNCKWSEQYLNKKIVGEVYTDLLYGINDKNQIVFFSPICQLLGEWNIRSFNPKRWQISYQILPKLLQRLNRLQWILNVNNVPPISPSNTKNKNFISKLSKSPVSQKSTKFHYTNTPIDGSQIFKVQFLANRYLQQNDLMELRQYVKMSTVKLMNMSKKNILYKKDNNGNLFDDKLGDGSSVKKINQINNERLGVQGNMKNSKTGASGQKKGGGDNNRSNQKQKKQGNRHVTSINNLPGQRASQSQDTKTHGNKNNMSSYPLSSYAIKRRNQLQGTSNSGLKNNFFEKKFQQKVEEQKLLKVHKKYIDHKVQETLKHAQQINMKYIQHYTKKKDSHHQDSLSKSNSHQHGNQKSLNNSKNTKQHAKKLLRLNSQTPSGGAQKVEDNNQQFNTATQQSFKNLNQGNYQPFIIANTNQLLMQQDKQRKQIQKNIDFVKRIQNCFQRLDQEYGKTWINNKSPVNQVESYVNNQLKLKMSPSQNMKNQNEQKNMNLNRNSQINKSIPKKNKTNVLNLPNNNPSLAHRPSIAFKLPNQQFLDKNSFKNPTINTMSIQSNKRSTSKVFESTQSQLLPNKKIVQFSNTKKVVEYQRQESEINLKVNVIERQRQKNQSLENTNQFINRNRKGSIIDNQIEKEIKEKKGFEEKGLHGRRSFSYTSMGQFRVQSKVGGNVQQYKNQSNLKSFENKQAGQLTKSRSVYGKDSRFLLQKQMALSNLRQSLIQFENFNKKYGNNNASEIRAGMKNHKNIKSTKNSRIKLQTAGQNRH